MAWIVEWQQPDEYEYMVTLFARESDAYMQAAHDMMEDVMSWDLSDPDIEAVAHRINDYVLAGDYKSALREYNDDQGEAGGEGAQYWYVYERKENVGARTPGTIIFQDSDEDEEEDEEEEEAPETPYTASAPGATCRGPCGQKSEYAYADRKDGTYCCYSCKMMSQVFGGKVP